ncbi:MAG: glycerol-3-phosphate dehydrogenase/oxidase [Acidobacteriota bacterium]|nr:glycerol-3-phosphate dehydrogenase/oxidase [Acidobacteriota bacterium]
MFNSPTHTPRLASLPGEELDVVVIGGGIIGAGIARDAALRGLRVALFEKRDFGSGTTAGSTRLIHGGLRYLEMLDFRLVRMDLRERETLLRIAPHLVKPLEFIMPFYSSSFFYRGKMKLGMMLYDLLSYDKSFPRHRFLLPSELKTLEPHLRQKGLQGAALYFDAQANSPERLCIENIIDADEHGAQTFNYAEVTGALRAGDAIDGVRVRDLLNDDCAEVAVKSRIVINASGAWFDRVAGNLTDAREAHAQIRTTKGAHITCPPVTNRAVVVVSPVDGRLMFVIPWLGYSWIGTTDTDFTGDPATAQTTTEDVDYMLRSVTEYFPALDTKQIYFSNAGVRALVKEEGSESSVSRMHLIADGARSGAKNLISVLGGKITGYRAIAEEAIDAVCAKLNVNASCLTARAPLPGARGEMTPSDASDAGLKRETVAHLFNLYGSRAREVINLAASNECLREPLSPHAPDVAAQVVFAARTEQCRRLVDFMLRRTLLGFSQDQGQSAAQRVASLLAQELDWSPARTATEMHLYQDYIATTQAFRDDGATTEQNVANNQRAVIERANKTAGAEA